MTRSPRRVVGVAFAALVVPVLVLGGALPAHAVPQLEVVEISDTGPATTVGQTVGYTVEARNPGTVALTNVLITFETGAAFPPFDLAVGSTRTFNDSITVTQADLDAGQISTDVTVAQTASALSDTVTVVIAVTQTATLSATATADVATISAVGDPVVFSVVATNTGNVTLSGLGATGAGQTLTCGAATLAPGLATTCTTTYLATQADLDARRLQPTFTVSASSPLAAPVAGTASVTVTAPAMLAATGGTLSLPALGAALVAVLLGAVLQALALRRGSRLA